MPKEVDHTKYGEVAAFVVPMKGQIHMVSVLPKCKHRDGWDQVRSAGGSQSYEPR